MRSDDRAERGDLGFVTPDARSRISEPVRELFEAGLVIKLNHSGRQPTLIVLRDFDRRTRPGRLAQSQTTGGKLTVESDRIGRRI